MYLKVSHSLEYEMRPTHLHVNLLLWVRIGRSFAVACAAMIESNNVVACYLCYHRTIELLLAQNHPKSLSTSHVYLDSLYAQNQSASYG